MMPAPVATPVDRRRARELRAQGLSAPEIGRLLGGVSDSTVRNWWRASECSDCGEPTGDAEQLRCQDCRNTYAHEHMKWTRAAVVDAIQRFAAEHGRPPHAMEWACSNPLKGYPSMGSVFRSSAAHRSAPFAYWADAIEAAGFPRPVQWKYKRAGRAGLGSRASSLLASLEEQSPQALHQLAGYGRYERQLANQSLRGLIDRGLVVRVGRALYALAESAVEEAA